MKFFLADDDPDIRQQIRFILEENGDEVVAEARDGEEAVELYKKLKVKPDIIILDVYMPIMNGLEVATEIKALKNKKEKTEMASFSPILFITGCEDDELLVKCFAIGDDILPKPISTIMARAKINSIKRHLRNFKTLNKSKAHLARLNQIHEEEFSLARDIFRHFSLLNNNTSGNIRYHSAPSTTFSGDIVLCTRSPLNSLYVLVGDLTGHGLPAAIAATPINKIFFTMASKGISISKIAQEINQNLFHLLPDNIFCAAFLMEMSADGKLVHLWSGGMPPMLVTDAQGILKQKIPCAHMPLGSQSAGEFESNIQTLMLDSNDRLYCFTDGITESENESGEMFGEERLYNILSTPATNSFEKILEQINEFSPDLQHDDITLVEIISKPLQWRETAEAAYLRDKKKQLELALPWEITMKLSGKDFQRGEPTTQIVQFLNNAIGFDMHQDTLSTILTELYSNALEHGLMKLDSGLKQDEPGFAEYYLARSKKLRQITDEQVINIHLSFTPYQPMPQIKITVSDTGNGFDPDNRTLPDESELHGRGQTLISSLCHHLSYSNDGRTASATYYLLPPH